MKKHVVLKNPLARKAWAAMQEAVAEIVEEHRRHGRPLAIWRDGKVVWIEPEPASAVRERPAAYKTRAHGKKS
jgi:hypothetical protein